MSRRKRSGVFTNPFFYALVITGISYGLYLIDWRLGLAVFVLGIVVGLVIFWFQPK